MKPMKTILFVCSGNSCRSQMAEGFGKYLAEGKFSIQSAGIFPPGIHPMTIQTMKEAGIDISDHDSTMLSRDMIDKCDYFITLCGSARDKCKPMLYDVKHIHWDIENPDILYTSEEDRRREFTRIRDDIKKLVENLFRQIEKGER
jgi:arsenate reductase